MKIASLMLGLLFTFSSWAGKIEVDVNGMSCGMCIEAITKELKNTDKAENISVSLEEKKARFSEIKDRKISDAEIKIAIKKAGYEAAKIRRN
jgi:copper chaperone CopZ